MFKLLTFMLLLTPMAALAVQQALPKVSRLHSVPTGQLAQPDEMVELPPPVSEWLDIYKTGKYQAAFGQLLDSMLSGAEQKGEEEIRLLNLLRAAFAEMETSLSDKIGGYKGYKIIKIVKQNEGTQKIYLEMLHEKGSMFMGFITSRTEKGWVVINFRFSPNIEYIFQSD